jgi:hypothetical protein
MTMKAATPLLCLLLGACAGGALPGEQAAPFASAKPAASARAVADAPPLVPSVAAAQPGMAAHSVEPPPGSAAERQQQARANCWMKVERERGLRDIDKRVAFVDRCVTDELKTAQP